MRILGIDPGSRNCGIAIIETDTLQLLDATGLLLPGDAPESLGALFEHMQTWIKQWKPERVALESVFFNNNISSAVKVGEARGVIILASQIAGCVTSSYTPQQAKKTLTGNGRADKDMIAASLAALKINVHKSNHANDAVALAICDAQVAGEIIITHTASGKARVKKQKK